MKNFRHWFFGLGTITSCTLSVMVYAQAQPSTTYSNVPQQSYPNSNSTVPQQSYATPSSQNQATGQALRIGLVNTKKCLEESKLGKQEQVNFEKMKNQMESILQEKEKALEEIESKLNDDDYMDSIAEDVANELKRKKRTIRNEGMQLQNQYMQTLQQANLKIVQKLTEVISKASTQVAQDPTTPLDVVFTDEACTYYSPRLDVSDRVIAKMNTLFDAEPKDNASKPR